jgi:hypothetical protein
MAQTNDGSPCALAGGHHAYGSGAAYTVSASVGAYTVGTDGERAGLSGTGVTACRGDGVITNSYDSDPFDCGSGQAGDPTTSTPATLLPNANPHDGSTSDPDPWAATYGALPQGASRPDPNGGYTCFGVDGYAWVTVTGTGGTVTS